jgi:hypothetical protein
VEAGGGMSGGGLIRIKSQEVLSKFSGAQQKYWGNFKIAKYPSQKKTVQNDVTLIHSSNLC